MTSTTTVGKTCLWQPDTFIPSSKNTASGKSFASRASCFGTGETDVFDMSSTAGPGITAQHSSRGIAVGDLDNDGFEEIVVVNLLEPPALLKNFGSRGNALLVRALTASGRDAIGARITVTAGHRKQIDEERSGGYHISQCDFRVHFGLGTVMKVDVTIRWPQGATEIFKDVAANQWIVAREGKGIVERHPFQPPPSASRQR